MVIKGTIYRLFFCIMLSCLYAAPTKIVGAVSVSTKAISEIAKFPSNDNPDAWNDAIKRLYATHWFDKITVDVEKDHATVTVKEYPILLGFKVTSRIDQLKPEKIIDMLNDFGVSRGKPVSAARLEQWRLGVAHELKRMGYAMAEADIVWHSKPQGVLLDVTLDAGSAVVVRKIFIEGNTVFPVKELLPVLEIKQDNILRWMDGAHKISREKLTTIEEKLRNFYDANGYFNANIQVQWRDVAVTKYKKSVDVMVHVDAGKPFTVHKVVPVGECGPFENHMRAVEGKAYQAAKIHDFLYKMSHLNEKYEIRLQPKLMDNSLNLIMICRALPPLVIRDVDIVGDGTDDLLLRRLLDFDVGDTWVGGWINSSKKRLLGQPFIAEVDIEVRPDVASKEADIIVHIEESKKNTMASFRASYENGGAGLSFGGGFSNRNFLGTGNALSFDSQYGHAMWYTDLQLLQPIVPMHASALMGFAFRVTDQNVLNMGPYKQDLASAYYGYRWLINDQTLLQTQITLKANHFKVFKEEFATSTGYFDQMGYDPLEFVWTNTWVKDTRDRAEHTTSGYVWKLGLGTVLPVFPGMMAYYTISPAVTGFYKVGELLHQPLVLRGNVQAGYGQSYGPNKGHLPFYSRYYAGGIGTVRGYNLFTLGPKYTQLSFGDYLPAQGGDWLLVGNLDLILPSPYPDFIQPSLFIDAGNVFLGNIDLEELRYSSGLSVGINTPFAQLTVTLASFFNASNERRNNLTIEMGRQF